MLLFSGLLHRRPRSNPPPRGTAVVELVLSLPVLTLLVVASMEACNMMFLNHSLTVASYEGVRIAIRHQARNEDVLACCNELLAARGVTEPSINMTPNDITAVNRGGAITITVTADCAANSALTPWFYNGKTISASTTMVKE